MACLDQNRLSKMRALALQFRAFAAETRQPDYRAKLSAAARDLEREAARLESLRQMRPTVLQGRWAG